MKFMLIIAKPSFNNFVSIYLQNCFHFFVYKNSCKTFNVRIENSNSFLFVYVMSKTKVCVTIHVYILEPLLTMQ